MKTLLIIKPILLTSGSVIVFIALILFFFGGDNQGLQTEIQHTPSLTKVEELTPSLTSGSGVNNVTQELTKQIAKQIVDANPTGPTQVQDPSGDGTTSFTGVNVPSASDVINKTFADAISKFDIKKIKPEIKDSDIQVIGAESKDLSETYFHAFNAIIEKDLGGLVAGADPSTTDFLPIVAGYDNAIAEFYALPVPQNLTSYHKRELQLLTAARNVFDILSHYDSDPAQAVLAIQFGDDLSTQVGALTKEITDYIAKNKLNI